MVGSVGRWMTLLPCVGQLIPLCWNDLASTLLKQMKWKLYKNILYKSSFRKYLLLPEITLFILESSEKDTFQGKICDRDIIFPAKMRSIRFLHEMQNEYCFCKPGKTLSYIFATENILPWKLWSLFRPGSQTPLWAVSLSILTWKHLIHPRSQSKRFLVTFSLLQLWVLVGNSIFDWILFPEECGLLMLMWLSL